MSYYGDEYDEYGRGRKKKIPSRYRHAGGSISWSSPSPKGRALVTPTPPTVTRTITNADLARVAYHIETIKIIYDSCGADAKTLT